MFEKIESLSSTLNTKSNEVNKLIEAANAELRSQNIGLEVWGPYLNVERSKDCDTQQTLETIEVLGYAFREGQWQLAVRTEEISDPESEDGAQSTVTNTSALTKVSRALRIEALRNIPALVEEIARRLAAEIQTIETAEKAINENKLFIQKL